MPAYGPTAGSPGIGVVSPAMPAEATAQPPVRYLPTDSRTPPKDGVGLCLSGGGYRAMLFHLGTLWRLNELGWLERLDRVSSVSGGSLTAAALGLAWPQLAFGAGVATRFTDLVVDPVRALARVTVDEAAIAVGLLTPDTIGERVSRAYAKHLLGEATLQDLPDAPRFIINATNLASGALLRLSKQEIADYRVGRVPDPTLPIADAVACSSAFPPVLSPFELDLRRASWETEEGNDIPDPEYRGELKLSDGGVYDNLGLETVYKKCRTVLVSDAGGHLADEPDPPTDWVRQTLRVLGVIDNQVRELRKSQVVDSYVEGERDGAYWGIRSDIANYGLPDALPAPVERTLVLAETPTRLRKLDDRLQERLINWGYALTDAALRKHVATAPPAPPPAGFPYPEAGV